MAIKNRKLVLYLAIPLGILILLALSISLVTLFRMRAEISKMTPIESQEVISGVYAIKDDSYINFYMVKSGNSFIAIDSGQNLNIVKNELSRLNLDPLKVAAVFLTHTDTDHVGALGLFPNARAYISREEEQMVNGKTLRMLIISNKLLEHYELLADNQDVEISGIKIHCILTPGHTPGSMSYIVNDVYLFTGDTLSLRNNKVHLFNDFFNMDTNQQRKSITKISKLQNVRYIFTAHYGYSDTYQGSFADWTGN